MANDTATRLLARVKELREARGLSQEAFAEKAGLGYKYYQHVESGRRRDLRLSTLEKLAVACGLKLWELLNLDVSPLTLAQDPPKNEFRTPPSQVARKTPKHQTRKKGV